MKEPYGFYEQDKLEEAWTPWAMRLLKNTFYCTVKNVRAEHLPYDFVVGDLTCDLKTNTIMKTSCNFFIETESVKGKKKGWLYNIKTDMILYVDVNTEEHWVLWLDALRSHEDEILEYPYREVKNKGWITCGHLVPVEVIEKWCYMR